MKNHGWRIDYTQEQQPNKLQYLWFHEVTLLWESEDDL